MMDNDLTERIRHLLAMAEHPNSNEHEAAIALEKAQKLLFENNLTRAEIMTEGDQSQPGIGKLDIMETSGYDWKSHLLGVLARGNLCQVVRSPHANTTHIFGTYDNVKATLEMYHWLLPELERIALNAWGKYRADGTGMESARIWRRGFYLGAADIIGRRLRESLNNFATGPGYALVPYNAQLVKDAIRRIFPSLSTSRISSRSYDGYASGKLAGQAIRLKSQGKLSGVMALK